MFPDEDPPSMEWDEYGCQLDAHIVALREAARAMGDMDVVMADQQVYPPPPLPLAHRARTARLPSAPL